MVGSLLLELVEYNWNLKKKKLPAVCFRLSDHSYRRGTLASGLSYVIVGVLPPFVIRVGRRAHVSVVRTRIKSDCFFI